MLCSGKMTDREKEAFIGGIEFARDWNLDIPPDDLRLYKRLIQERTKKRMNKVILMGRLTRDPNVRYTQQNGSQESMCVARYTLAVDRRGARDGQQSADFISCVAFGKNGEFAEKYLKQGTKIVVTGRIETTAEAFVEAVLQIGMTLQQAKTAILKMSSLRDAKNRKNTNNWRKMHGLPMRRKRKARKKHERGKGADCH